MHSTIDIITITKDDLEGVAATIVSTRKLRACHGVRQIVIDGSEQSAKGKVQALLVGEKNIDYIWQEPAGIAQAFNLGVSSSSAEWIWFLNGRDEVHPCLDENLLLQILNASQAEIIICEIEYMQTGERFKHPPLWKIWPPLYWVPHPATIVKRDLFVKYGFFSQEFKVAMDGELWVRFFTKDIVVDMLSMPVVLYDLNGVSGVEKGIVVKEVDKFVIKNFSLLFRLWLYRGAYLFRALRRKFLF